MPYRIIVTTWLAAAISIIVFLGHFFYELVFKKNKKPQRRVVTHGQVLGKGSFGTVTSCVYQNQIVAIKKFHVRNSSEFEIEVSMLSFLSGHPNVVRMLDHFIDTSGGLCIVFEKLGESLLQRGRVYPQLRNSITRQILNALAFLESKGVIHGDLKPENIGFVRMSNESILLKILDFGVSETFHTVFSYSFQQRINRGELLLTSRPYASYESIMLDHVQPHTDKCDVWALGAIVSEMITGVQLFPDIHEDNTKEDNEEL
jgi:serine/threonine protein kinase